MSVRNSLRLKLTLGFAVFLGVLFSVSGFSLYSSFKWTLIRNIDQTMDTVGRELRRVVEDQAPELWKTSIENEEEELFTIPLFIQILEVFPGSDRSPRIVEKSRALADSALSFPQTRPAASSEIIFAHETRLEKQLSRFPIRTAVSQVIPKGSRSFVVQAGTTMKETYQTANNLLLILLIASPLLLVLSSVGGYIVLSRALAPVNKVVAAAQKITAEDLSHRIDVSGGKDELGQLVETFNAMIARLEQSIHQIRHFTSDVSHELKTPLTAIFSEIDVALRKERSWNECASVLGTIREDAQRLEKIVDNLLFLSRMESQDRKPDFGNVSVDEIVLQTFEKMEPLARKKNITINITKLEPFAVKGDETLLGRLLTNLIDNAVKYTLSGGRVDIALMKSSRQGILSIMDTGIGIPEESLPYIFDRFFRVDQVRSRESGGSGLGLAIAKWIAAAHGASIEVQSRLHEGTVFTVTFPLQD
jgi:heavy metal sensor kinase